MEKFTKTSNIGLRMRQVGLIGIMTILFGSVVYGGMHYHNKATKTNTAATVPRDYALVFNDEFSETTLNTGKWSTCYESYAEAYQGCTNFGNDESQWYKASQVGITNGYLSLKAQRQETKGPNKAGEIKSYEYLSGMISSGRPTKNAPAKWAGAYGYFESRIKIPDGQGVWPAFWLAPIDHTWPPEIDIMEVLGHRPNQLLTTYFWPQGDNPAKDSSTHTAKTRLNADWHIYSATWTPTTITWYLDGTPVKHVSSPNVPSKPMQIILNLAVGGKLPGYPDRSTPDQLEMLVDYVRVYQEKPSQ